MEKELVKDKKR